MKKMFVLVTVFAILLNLSFEFVTCDSPVEEFVSYENFSATIVEERNSLMDSILQEWMKCRESMKVPKPESVSLYVIYPDEEETINQKRMMDCTLRAMGVITGDDFQDGVYTTQIRKLLLSYTSFDMEKQSDEVKQQVRKAIDDQLVKVFYRNESCYPIDRRLVKATILDKSNKPLDYKLIPSNLIPGLCHELLQSYELAVQACKDRKDPKGDSAITAWMIVECINRSNMDEQFIGPFYPGMFAQAVWEMVRDRY